MKEKNTIKSTLIFFLICTVQLNFLYIRFFCSLPEDFNMEFFEKAHSLKNTDAKKDIKSEEKMKKQLKQMLYGYKKSDNELIRKSEEKLDDNYDSSVSGFSDLNLTYTGSDNETTKATIDSSDLDSLPNLNEEDASLPCKIPNVLQLDGGDNVALEQNIDTSESLDETASSLLSNISIPDSSGESCTSDSSVVFDVDGVLASKIHDRLNSIINAPKEKLKRKTEENINNTQKGHNSVDLYCNLEVEDLFAQKKIKKKSRNEEFASTEYIQGKSKWDHYILSDHHRKALAPSPSFVSITATNVKTQKFDDIFGHYKNTTIKSIGTDQSKITFSTLNTLDEWKISNTNLDEADSLVAELGTEINENDACLDLTDSSSQVNYECANEIDNTAESSPVIDLENSVLSIEKPVNEHKVYSADNCHIFVLRHPTYLFIHGKVKVKKLAGTAQIYGYNLQDSFCKVYAPLNNFAQAVKTVEANNDYYGLFNKLTTKGVSIPEAEEIVTTLGSYDVVIVLEKLNDGKMDFVEKFFNITNLFTPLFANLDINLKKPSEDLGCVLYASQPYKHLEESPNWHQAVKLGLCEKSKGIVCGGKGAGKSTFLRFYVNQLLINGPVLVIDLDPGQCEFTPPGNISATVVNEPLLGPNFTHLAKPIITLNLAMISTMDNPKRYLTAVNMLLTECAKNPKLHCMPWIVNTMGMCNAVGLKFMCFIILKTRPTFLMQIELQAIKKNFMYRLTPQKIEELREKYRRESPFIELSQELPPSYFYIIAPAETYRVNKNAGNDNFTLAPRDERYLNFLAYFGELAEIHKCVDLLAITPYSVRLQDVYVVTNTRVHPASISQVLNGKVVALCQQSVHPSKAKVFTMDNTPLNCCGHGLIRSIDYKRGELYVITPIPPKDLSLVNTILYADWVPELRGQEKNLPEGTVVPYRTQSEYHQRQFMFTPRRRFNPLQLLKISRKS